MHPETSVVMNSEPPTLTAIGGYVFKWDGEPGERKDADDKPFLERFLRGCFRGTLFDQDVAAKLDGSLIARKSEGTLRLRDEPDGLRYEMVVGADLVDQVKQIKGAQIVFASADQGGEQWITIEDGANKGKRIRAINRANLLEILFTTKGA